jgi:tetratricopeptide (TPR) repeat protein
MRKLLRFVGVAAVLAVLSLLAGRVVPGHAADNSAAPIGKSSHDAAAPLLDQLKTAKDANDGEIDKLVQRSTMMSQFQMFDEGLAVLDTVVAKAPDYAEGWNRRATLLYMMHDFDRSLADIQKVLTLEPRHFGAISGLGLISMAKGDKSAALSAYKKVLEINPQNLGARQSVEQLDKELQGNPI